MMAQENKTGPISKSVTHFSKKSFFSEIPQEVRKESIVGENLSFLKKIKYFSAAIDRKKWEKVEDSAKNVDKNLESSNKNDNEDKPKDVELQNDSIQKLNKSCFEYINKNKKVGFKTEDEMEKANKNNQAYDANGLEIGAHGRKMKNLIKKRLFTADKLIRKSVKMLNPQMSSFALTTGQTFKRGTKITLDYGLEYNKLKDSMKLFQSGDPKPEDLRQGSIGDCWLQASLISFLTAFGSEPIKKLFTDLGGGKVAVKIHDAVGLDEKGEVKWEPKTVLVDKQVESQLIYNRSNALWTHVLQQAIIKANVRNHYNKLLGGKTRGKEKKGQVSYDVIRGGSQRLASGILFGRDDTVSIDKESLDEAIKDENKTNEFNRKCATLYDYIRDYLNKGQAMTIMFKNNPGKNISEKRGSSGEDTYKGLLFGHLYAVVGCEESDGEKWIYLINPHANRQGVKYSRIEKEGKAKYIRNIEGADYEKEEDNGRFKLKLKTAYKYLNKISKLSKDNI